MTIIYVFLCKKCGSRRDTTSSEPQICDCGEKMELGYSRKENAWDRRNETTEYTPRPAGIIGAPDYDCDHLGVHVTSWRQRDELMKARGLKDGASDWDKRIVEQKKAQADAAGISVRQLEERHEMQRDWLKRQISRERRTSHG